MQIKVKVNTIYQSKPVAIDVEMDMSITELKTYATDIASSND